MARATRDGGYFRSHSSRSITRPDIRHVGLPTKLIGRRLSISAATAKAHISSILRVFNVANRLQAVVAAQRHGLLTMPGPDVDHSTVTHVAPSRSAGAPGAAIVHRIAPLADGAYAQFAAICD